MVKSVFPRYLSSETSFRSVLMARLWLQVIFTYGLIVNQDGTVWAAGRSDNCQLGDGSNTDLNNFVMVMSGGATDIAAAG